MTEPSPSGVTRVRGLTVRAAQWIARGGATGVAVSLGLLVLMSPRDATDTAFALGALVFGFGVTAWSTAVGLGNSIEGARAHLPFASGWTEASAREAFFVLSWTGAGWMGAAALAAVALGV